MAVPSPKLVEQLQGDVRKLAGTIGERNYVQYEALQEAERYITAEMEKAGYKVTRQAYRIGNKEFANLEAEKKGDKNSGLLFVIGAHYDSVTGSPGANDNGTGVASLLALARHFKNRPTDATLRFVAFVNEEPPFFQTQNMGSLRYAEDLKKKGLSVNGMISLETMGYYSNRAGSQNYPPGIRELYPDAGNFIGFVANKKSASWLERIFTEYKATQKTPAEKGVFPEELPGVGWSDHWAFWQQSYPALMITDTAPFRYPHYHTQKDTPEKVDYQNLALLTEGLITALENIARAEKPRPLQRHSKADRNVSG